MWSVKLLNNWHVSLICGRLASLIVYSLIRGARINDEGLMPNGPAMIPNSISARHDWVLEKFPQHNTMKTSKVFINSFVNYQFQTDCLWNAGIWLFARFAVGVTRRQYHSSAETMHDTQFMVIVQKDRTVQISAWKTKTTDTLSYFICFSRPRITLVFWPVRFTTVMGYKSETLVSTSWTSCMRTRNCYPYGL